jgi:hypothetical protein
MDFHPMGLLFLLVPVFIGAVFIFVFGMIGISIFQGISTWVSNNAQPVQTRRVRVATKRQHVSGGSGDSSASTWYYATFEDLSNGDRNEFAINSVLYSGIADDDIGRLTHQGTRFLGFERERNVTPDPAPRTEPRPPEPDRICTYCKGLVPRSSPKCPSCGAADFEQQASSGTG